MYQTHALCIPWTCALANLSGADDMRAMMTEVVILEPRAIGCREFCYIELKPERFSNFQKTSAEKKFETCGLGNLGKLIIVACWSPLKGRQLLTEARLTKTPSVSSRPRQIAKISLFLDKLTTTTTICFAVGFVL